MKDPVIIPDNKIKGVLMNKKNFFKLFGIIAVIAIVGLSMISCKDDTDDGVQKTLVITDIPVTYLNQDVMVALCSDINDLTNSLTAFNSVNLKSGTATIPLVFYNEPSKQWTGIGDYYILMFFSGPDGKFYSSQNPSDGTDDVDLIYTAGGATSLKYTIKDDTTTIAYDKFMILQ